MQLTSDHLDLADQAAHELHDQQLLLSLWNSYDPNLFRTGKFLFSVDSKDLRNSIRATQLPQSSADHIWIEIDSARLKCVASTRNCTFECSALVSLSKASAIGPKPIRIEVRRLFLANFCEAFEHVDKVLEFEFDENEKCLVYTEERHDKIISSIRIPAERRPMPDNSLSTLTLYDVPDTDMLRKAIDYVGPMSLRKAPDDFPCRGIQFAERTAFGAYQDAASKFHSSRLPDGQFNLPKREIRKIRALLGRFRGPCKRFTSSDRTGFQSERMSCSWPTTPNWKTIPYSPFECMWSNGIHISSTELLLRLRFAAGLFDDLVFQSDEEIYPLVKLSSTKIACGTLFNFPSRQGDPRTYSESYTPL